jgi:DNA-directed RNA polymerase specialized sigma24 family protein
VSAEEEEEEGAAAAFLSAATQGDQLGTRRAMTVLTRVLRPAIERSVMRQASLVRRCRLESDDVVQRVFERMLAAPPANPEGREPLVVLIAWSRAVAINYLLDLARRVGREASEEEEDEQSAPSSRTSPQERQHDAMERWELARRCADTELVRHKHLRELFYAMAEDPDLPARDLAMRIGLVEASSSDEEKKRAEQYVWKLRERVHTKLADYLEARRS